MQQRKEQILRDNQKNWNALAALLQRVPEKWMAEPNAIGEWSIKDVLGHTATWDAEVVKEVRQLVQGGPPFVRPPGFNDQQVATQRPLSLDEIRRLMEKGHEEAMAYLTTLPEAAYEVEGVQRRAHGCMAHHYAEHAEDIQRWLGVRKASERARAQLA